MVEIIRDQQLREIMGQRGPGKARDEQMVVDRKLELGWVKGRRDSGRWSEKGKIERRDGRAAREKSGG